MAYTGVKYLHSELSGAPVLNGTPGSMLAVLEACLCNGWGLQTATSVVVSNGIATATLPAGHAFEPGRIALVAGAVPTGLNGEQRIKSTTGNSASWEVALPDGSATGTITLKLAPAGWVKALSSANVAAFRSASAAASGVFVRIDDSNARYARIRLAESMPDINTLIGPTPTDQQASDGLYISKSGAVSSAARRWILVASEKFVVLAVAYNGSYLSDYEAYVFGDYPSLRVGDPYNSIIIANPTDSSGSGLLGIYNALLSPQSANGVYLVRSYVGVGGSMQGYCNKIGGGSGWSGSSSFPVGPNPINNGIDLCPTSIIEGGSGTGNRRGMLPAVYGIPHNLGAAFDSKDIIPDVLGLPGHSILAVRFYGASSASGSYRFAIDITGPWE